ncbi:14688_t:CDS:1, partial [Dentiscutata erythropus]
AIKDYKEKRYDQAFKSFCNLATTDCAGKNNDEIYGVATYYIALCYMYGNGVEQDRE